MKLNFQKLHIYSLSTRWLESELIFAYGQWFLRFSKLAYWGMKLDVLQKFKKLHIHSLSTPRCRNWAYFRSTDSGFRDTGRFSKLPYLGMKLDVLQKVQEVAHTLSFYPGGVGGNWAYLRSTDSGFRHTDPFSKLPYWRMKRHLSKVPKSCAYKLYPRGSKLRLFSLHGQWFPPYGLIFKSSTSCPCTPFLTQGVQIELIFALRTAVSEIRPDFQSCHIGAWNLAISTPEGGGGVEIELIFALWAAISSILADFQTCHIWTRKLTSRKSLTNCRYTPSTPTGRNWAYFRSTDSGFRDTGPFAKLPYLGMKLDVSQKFNWSKVSLFSL